jgi:hypothetical protein
MAEVLKVSPFYYTGEIDERAELSNADIVSFLQNNGYSNLAEELAMDVPPQKPGPKPKRKYNRKSAPAPASKTEAAQEPEEAPEPVLPVPEAQAVVEDKASEPVIIEDTIEIKITLPENKTVHDAVAALSEEEIVSLLKALLIKEKAGGAPAKMAEIIKRCLLV